MLIKRIQINEIVPKKSFLESDVEHGKNLINTN